jgi:magnesium transporter
VTFVTELYTATGNILQSDDDMAQMYLTESSKGTPREIESHDEVEMLLETFYSQFEDCLNRIKELISSIKSTQDFLNITLDSIRNRMMQFEITMAMGALAISIGTFVAGVFGMNLVSRLEDHQSMCLFLFF